MTKEQSKKDFKFKSFSFTSLISPNSTLGITGFGLIVGVGVTLVVAHALIVSLIIKYISRIILSKYIMEGAGRPKFISKAFITPKETLIQLAQSKGIKGADKMTIMDLLKAIKLVPTHSLIKEYATKWGIKVSRGDGKEKIIMLIRRYEFIHKK